MRRRTSTFVAALSVALMVSACTNDPIEPGEDDLAGETGEDGELGKADHSTSTFTYYTMRPDMRRCVFPLCGGVYVKRVNRSRTQCADGKWRDECYVAELDLSGLGLSDDQVSKLRSGGPALFRGEVEEKTFGNYGNMGAFVVSEAWRGLADHTADGVYVKVYDNGIRCITTPCPSQSEAKLNSWRATDLDELDFSLTSATEDQLNAAYTAIAEGGLLVAGWRYWWWENGGWHKGRAVTQFYVLVKPDVQSGGECYVGGCSSQYCSDQEGVISTCEWRPEYACYRDATCERQADGQCGWTPTEDLTQCLANPPTL